MIQRSVSLLVLIALIQFLGIQHSFAQNENEKVKIDTRQAGKSKSDYDQLRVTGGSQSVGADLANDDTKKNAWLNTDLVGDFSGYYDFKRNLNRKLGIALGTDYMFLNQFASFSFSDKQAASGIYRLYGTWEFGRKNAKNHGSLYFKIENRHSFSGEVTPRNLGYDAGSALSTASFKDFGWGLTNLYWKQHFDVNKIALIAGIMDPGDWLDLYPQLNPYKYFLNEAFFNSTAMAIPNQGLGVVVHAQDIIGELYLSAGLHDANGEPTMWISKNIRSFFQTREYLYWAELGWDFSDNVLNGQTAHIMYWH